MVHAGDATPGVDVAKRLFEEGQELETKQDFAGALAKFRASEQIKATAGNRYHKGYCLEMMGKLAAAIEEYDSAEKLAREQNKTETLAVIRTRLEPLRGRVPKVSLSVVGPREAEVQIDGVAVPAALVGGEAFRVDPGEHTFSAKAAGYEPASRKVVLAESDAVTRIPISMKALGPPPPPPPPPPPRDEVAQPRSRSLAAPIATTVGAVALAGLGVGMFVLAGNAQSEAKKDCPSRRDCSDEGTTVRLYDSFAAGAWLGAAGLAALSIVLWVSPGPSAPAASTPAASSKVKVVGRSSWVGLEGTF